jgi:NADH-quinone oxidoreductase subunit L
MELMLMGVVVALVLVMIVIAAKKFAKSDLGEPNEPTGFGKILANKWYVDELYDFIVVKPVNFLASFFSRVVDNSIIDGLVNGIGRGVQFSARQMRLLQSGQIGSYVLIMTVSIILFFIFQLLWKA